MLQVYVVPPQALSKCWNINFLVDFAHLFSLLKIPHEICINSFSYRCPGVERSLSARRKAYLAPSALMPFCSATMSTPSIRSARFSVLGVTPSASGSKLGKSTVWRGSLINLARGGRKSTTIRTENDWKPWCQKPPISSKPSRHACNKKRGKRPARWPSSGL